MQPRPPTLLPEPLAEWDFDLPPELIAQEPPLDRDGGRLLVVGERLDDRSIRELPGLLRADDLLVFNDVKVRRARLAARRATGGAVEVLVLRATGNEAEVLVKPARKIREGERLLAGPGEIELLAHLDDGRARVRFHPDLACIEAAVGSIPLPPYMARPANVADEERYQTVFAREGELRAAAAPTAGLHFSPALLAQLDSLGVERVPVSLEVGLGTFRPLTEAQIAKGELHPERFDVPVDTWAAVERAQRAGRRIVAVGTTSVRVLESATGPGPGETRIFLREGWVPQRVGALFTNFHLPRSSLLMLVAAFAGRAAVREAYAHAVARRYRFFSYGDACFFPAPRPSVG